jgi:hypothetical protein
MKALLLTTLVFFVPLFTFGQENKIVYDPVAKMLIVFIPVQNSGSQFDAIKYALEEKNRWLIGHKGLVFNGYNIYAVDEKGEYTAESCIPFWGIYRQFDRGLKRRISAVMFRISS